MRETSRVSCSGCAPARAARAAVRWAESFWWTQRLSEAARCRVARSFGWPRAAEGRSARGRCLVTRTPLVRAGRGCAKRIGAMQHRSGSNGELRVACSRAAKRSGRCRPPSPVRSEPWGRSAHGTRRDARGLLTNPKRSSGSSLRRGPASANRCVGASRRTTKQRRTLPWRRA